ncbi:hypothetical protein E4U11_005973 [Claviceps purpurea]|nr:hypothetical protein E4U11_005973 [Claviceps purpurea]
MLLKGSPKLEHLEILDLTGLSLPSDVKIWNRLRHVSIDSDSESFYDTEVGLPGAFPQTFLTNAASSLEHLEFTGVPHQWFNGLASTIPSLPNLKTLRIGDNPQEEPDQVDEVIPFPVFPLSTAFPKLEQLCIGPDLPCLDPGPLLAWQYMRDTIWPNLKVLVFEPCVPTSDTYAEQTRLTLRLMMGLKSLQYISLESEDKGDRPCIFSDSDDLIPGRGFAQYSEFQNLRVFESRTVCISPEGAKTLLSAIESKHLTSYSIVFPDGPFEWAIGDASILHLKNYDWLRGAPSIHTLGVFEFRFRYHSSGSQNSENMLLPQFLATFPNLRTLKIRSRHYFDDEFARLMLSILTVTHLKTIYMTLIPEGKFFWLNHVAQARGVQFFHETPPLFGYAPQWPIPLKS